MPLCFSQSGNHDQYGPWHDIELLPDFCTIRLGWKGRRVYTVVDRLSPCFRCRTLVDQVITIGFRDTDNPLDKGKRHTQEEGIEPSSERTDLIVFQRIMHRRDDD